ncbi:DNA-directed RNA polymerase subunit omega [Candidatus Phytoplasma luffae]|uniref:DNA-directed RNA polymerase subunit omega n=1 Tax=Loofah witches'-broom phytoplasma TaxID=35773 RepID=A0A975FJ06_LOWBP|nr:DNA-directed RNA polymerase subunit omega [Candidatus Phytoplasma luffae]QTX02774.1 DNA-directed RNA polymerase subunit omega [Candidatus Phytoplasma luffae]
MLKKKEGLNYPSIDELLKRIDSKYKLAYLSSKIAHIIETHNIDVSHISGNKILSKALSEIINGNFNIVFKKD